MKCALVLGLIVGGSQDNTASKDFLSEMSLGKVIQDFLLMHLGTETKHLKLLALHGN